MKRVASRRAGWVLIALGAIFVTLAACSDQAEGERCDFESGVSNGDCADGLVCLPTTADPRAPRVANPAFGDFSRCCPADALQATQPACMAPQNPLLGDSSAPADTGAADAAADVGSDAADSGTDSSDAADAADSG